MRDMLQELWDSTHDLHHRFFPDKPPSFEMKRRVLFEEFGEFTQAIDMEDEPEDWCNEAADLMVTIMGLLQGMYLDYDDLRNAIDEVIAKNNAKTLDTHKVRADGKIARVQSNGKS